MKFYYITKAKGKAGCATRRIGVTEDYETKAQVKRAKKSDSRTVIGVYTEMELAEAWGEENAKRFMAEAKPW